MRQTLEIPAGAARREPAVITCPEGLRVADLLPPTGAKLRVAYTSATIVGQSRVARVNLTGPALSRTTRVDGVGALPASDARRARSAPPTSARRRTPTHRVSVREQLLRVAPGGAASGSVRRGQPVAVLRTSGAWSRVVTDSGRRGWLPASVLAPIAP